MSFKALLLVLQPKPRGFVFCGKAGSLGGFFAIPCHVFLTRSLNPFFKKNQP